MSVVYRGVKPFQRRINPGDEVEITLVGAREYPGNLKTWNPVWETDDSVSVIFEEYYFDVLVAGKKRFIGMELMDRYTSQSSMGGIGRLDVKRDRINAESQQQAADGFIAWIQRYHAKNDDWHFLKKADEVRDLPDGLPYYTVPPDTTPDAPLGPKYVLLENPVSVDGVTVYGKRFDYGADKLAKVANTAARQVIARAFVNSAQHLDWEEDRDFGSRKPFYEYIDCTGDKYAVVPAGDADKKDGLDAQGHIIDKALYERLSDGIAEWIDVK